jgi:hypothetical protein
VTRKTRFKYLRTITLYYKYWLPVDEIAKRFGYTPKYVQKVLCLPDLESYVRRLSNWNTYRARQRLTVIISLMQSGKYHDNIPKHNEGRCCPDKEDQSAFTHQK